MKPTIRQVRDKDLCETHADQAERKFATGYAPAWWEKATPLPR